MLARADHRFVASSEGIVAMKVTTVPLRASSRPEKKASDLYDLGRVLVDGGHGRAARCAALPEPLAEVVAGAARRRGSWTTRAATAPTGWCGASTSRASTSTAWPTPCATRSAEPRVRTARSDARSAPVAQGAELLPHERRGDVADAGRGVEAAVGAGDHPGAGRPPPRPTRASRSATTSGCST